LRLSIRVLLHVSRLNTDSMKALAVRSLLCAAVASPAAVGVGIHCGLPDKRSEFESQWAFSFFSSAHVWPMHPAIRRFPRGVMPITIAAVYALSCTSEWLSAQTVKHLLCLVVTISRSLKCTHSPVCLDGKALKELSTFCALWLKFQAALSNMMLQRDVQIWMVPGSMTQTAVVQTAYSPSVFAGKATFPSN
jgi:hypothetical protein